MPILRSPRSSAASASARARSTSTLRRADTQALARSSQPRRPFDTPFPLAGQGKSHVENRAENLLPQHGGGQGGGSRVSVGDDHRSLPPPQPAPILGTGVVRR